MPRGAPAVNVKRDAAAAPEPPREDAAASVLERMLAGQQGESAFGKSGLHESTVEAWSGTVGTLAGGHTARLATSCLLQPVAGDRVLVWAQEGDMRWILSVIERQNAEAPAKLAFGGPLTIEAPRVGISANAVHVVAEDFLTSTRNRHAVEETRTETVRTRVAQVGTDIRRATTVDDQIEGTLLQRTGTWISSTAREARLRARTFLFD